MWEQFNVRVSEWVSTMRHRSVTYGRGAYVPVSLLSIDPVSLFTTIALLSEPPEEEGGDGEGTG